MVQAFAVLLLAQLGGEGLVHLLALPVPGPVAGLLLLALALIWRERAGSAVPLGETELGQTATGLLGHLSLLFVPAAVGVVQQGAVLARNGAALAAVIVVSTVLALVATAATFAWALRFVPPAGTDAP